LPAPNARREDVRGLSDGLGIQARLRSFAAAAA